MTRRVVLGKYNDGVTFGLRVSLPGVDALTASSAVPGFSFDSEWSDIVKLHTIALVSWSGDIGPINFPGGGGTTNPPGWKVYHGLGYKAFLEARLYTGGVIRDDYTGTTANSTGVPWTQWDNNLGYTFAFGNSSFAAYQFLVLVWPIVVPTQ